MLEKTIVPIGESMTPKEVADLTGYALVTIRRWLRKGYLKSVRDPGGFYRISRAAVDDVVNFKQGGPQQEAEAVEN